MTLRYFAIESATATALRAGGADANGQPPERVLSDGKGNPCRHCLGFVPQGQEMLIAAYRPFEQLHPYAETGPIFLCADPCPRHEGAEPPPSLTSSPTYLLKAYSADERILYGTGQITPAAEVGPYAEALLKRSDVAFVDVRSARNNCFLLRIGRER